MTQINWDVAPKDAEYWQASHTLFYKFSGSSAFYWNENNAWDVSAFSQAQIKSSSIKRPKPVNSEPTHPTTSVQFLAKSKKLQKERGKQYDSPSGERSFDKVAAMFTAATGIALEGHHIALIQTHLKYVRAYSNTRKVHQDSLEDAVSYSALWAESFSQTISKKENSNE